MPDSGPVTGQSFHLDDTIRGVPPGVSALESAAVAAQDWHPAEGVMSLPVLTMDQAVYAQNRDAMMAYVRAHGVAIAPHAKTPLIPELAHDLVAAGAWATTVADIRQASVMLRAGLKRLVIANQVGGRNGARRLAGLLANWPEAEVFVCADSVAAAQALIAAWDGADGLPRLQVLVEVGAGRAGARDRKTAKSVIGLLAEAGPGIRLAGVSAYEGSAIRATPEATGAAIKGLMHLMLDVLADIRSAVGPEHALVVTAGGSVQFDRVVKGLAGPVAADGNAMLLLRSGAIFFHDHGTYHRSLQAMDARGGFDLGAGPVAAATQFKPALRLWAEVLSCPEPGLVVCGYGARDAAGGDDMPRPLNRYRDGAASPLAGVTVTKQNDQHAFLSTSSDCDIKVGDVLEFGISHPCLAFDLYRVVFGVDRAGRVRHAYQTWFG